MSYPLAYDCGVVGNHFSSALISRLGSIEWCSFPFLDSPSHFSSYLNRKKGGYFQISPQGEFRSEQRYIPGTPILETLFETPHGTGILRDWMPADKTSLSGPILYRQVQVIEGKISWQIQCAPRFLYGEIQAQVEKYSGGILFRGNRPEDIALLSSDIPLEISGNGSSASRVFTLQDGQTLQFTWAWGRQPYSFHSVLEDTIEYWRPISHHCPPSGCTIGGPWHDTVARSSLILRVLFSNYSGAIADSIVKTSRDPITGAVTWDHRFASIRDGAMAIQAMVNLGYSKEAQSHFSWLARILERDGIDGLQAYYTLDGGRIQPDPSKPFWNSSNIAQRFQLDIYGHIALAANEYFRVYGTLPSEMWPKLTEIADYICQAWRRPDHGPSGEAQKPEHFVVSKLFCWAALDQISKIAIGLGQKPTNRWVTEKAILHRTICDQGYDSYKNSFTKSFGDREIDSSAVWIPLLNFLPIDDPRITGTIDRIQSELATGVFIRKSNELNTEGDQETLDLWSSFSLVSCLALMGRIDEASDHLAELCTYVGPLGLVGDDMNTDNPNHIPARFPSASAHLALVNAALYIALAKRRSKLLFPLMGGEEIQPLGKTA